MASASNELRIVLVGKTGNGKSATGNSLLSGRARFKASGGAASSTTKCEFERNEISDVNGKIVKLLVVDTPGFFDTNPSNTNEIVKKKITSEIFNLTSPGVHAFLIILSGNGRFSPEEKDTVDLIEQIFGSGVAQYCIVVFTCLDELRDSEDYTNLDDYVSKGPDALKELVRKCGSRKFAIDNKSRENGLMKHVKELVKMIDNMVRANGGKCYTNAEYERIERSRRAACGGHRCPECGGCRDWYYAGSQTDLDWIARNKTWTKYDFDRWNRGGYYKNFKSRTDKTCTYSRLYEGDDDYDGYRGHGTFLDFMHDLTLAFQEDSPAPRIRRPLHKEEICDCSDNNKL